VNRHSSFFKNGDRTVRVDKRRIACCHSLFVGKKVSPVEIHLELMTVHGASVMTVQHVHKWCREFGSGRVNVMDEQWSGRPSTSVDLVQDIDAAVQADRRESTVQL
jgi:hypothetical protein